jgi:hypothetical protein
MLRTLSENIKASPKSNEYEDESLVRQSKIKIWMAESFRKRFG